MSSCEKCWSESRLVAEAGLEPQVDAYRRLIRERNCTPEEQAGEYAGECPHHRRMTLHQHTRECMVPGCPENTPPAPEGGE